MTGMWRRSRDVLTSRLGLVSDKILNVSVSFRSRSNMFLSRPSSLVSGLGPLRLVETFYACAAAAIAILTSITFVA